MEQVTESSSNVFADLGFENEEAILLKLRASLLIRLVEKFPDTVDRLAVV